MEKIKILAVIDHLGKGGAERQFINLVNNLNKEIFEVHVFITERPGERFNELSSDIKTYGFLRSDKRKTLDALRLLRRTIIAINPSIVQTWLDYSTFITALALKTTAMKIKFVASHRTSTEELYNSEVSFGKIKKSLLVWAYKQACAVTTNSKVLVEQLHSYGITRARLIYNGLDLVKHAGTPSRGELRKKLGLVDNIFYIAFVGALVERKGIRHLVQAIKNLNRHDCKALIIGDGPLRDTVNELTRDDERFFVAGHQPNAIEYIKASNLLVLPSFYEGLPNVIIEAMAVGTPVIATNIYGIPELIEDGINGRLVPVKDSGSITSAIQFMYDDPAIAESYAEASRKRSQFFSIERMVQEYEGLYSGLLQLEISQAGSQG